ncbi:MAG TPA: hypothetical protein VM658_07175 [bacterium]|nr:hypothetical protein [bacterium]
MTEPDLTLDDLLNMNNAQRKQIMMAAHPIGLDALDNTMYRGIDLSLPPIMNKILWKTFRKTFVRDPQTGGLRGWNVRMEQTGWDGPGKPMTDSKGGQVSFGHYRVLPARGLRFPGGWSGDQFLDYTIAGNPWYDPAGLGYCPLVAVNKGSNDLLLGWEVFKLGPVFVPLPDFWALKLEGPLDAVVPVPCP